MNKLNISMGYKKGLEVFFAVDVFFCFAFCFTSRSHQYVAFLHLYLWWCGVLLFFIIYVDLMHCVLPFECSECCVWDVRCDVLAQWHLCTHLCCVLSLCIRFIDWLVSLCIVYYCCCCCIFFIAFRVG